MNVSEVTDKLGLHQLRNKTVSAHEATMNRAAVHSKTICSSVGSFVASSSHYTFGSQRVKIHVTVNAKR